MAEQIITIGVSATLADSPATSMDAVVDGDQVPSYIRAVNGFEATIIDPAPIQPPEVQAGPGNPAGNQPYVPLGYQPVGYVAPTSFDPSLLDILSIPPENRRSLTVQCTYITIGTERFDEYFFSGDWSGYYDDQSQGQLVLKWRGGRTLNPRHSINSGVFVVGQRVLYRQQWRDGIKIVCDAFISDVPDYNTGGAFGTPTLTIPLGDRFIKANRDRLERTTPYCGGLPTTLGQAARIYWSLNVGETLAWPTGGPLPIVLSQFLETPPYEFISSLYAGVGLYVATSPEGEILIRAHPDYDPDDVLELDTGDALQLELRSEGIQPFSHAIGTNEYTSTTDPATNYYTYTELSNGFTSEIAAGNMNPFWLGGPTRTEHQVWELGNEEIRRVSRMFGYAPVGTILAIDTEDSEESNCAPPNPGFIPPGSGVGTEVEFRLVQTTTSAKTVIRHISGAYLVSRDVTEVTGEHWYESKDGTQWRRYDGSIEGTATEYRNQSLFSPNTCERDFEVIIQDRISANYGLRDQNSAGDGKVFVLLTGEREQWIRGDSRQQANAGQFSVAAGEWRFIRTQRLLDEINGGYLYPQAQTGVGRPPAAMWIDRPTTEIHLETTPIGLGAIEQEFGRLVSNPIRFDYAFTVDDLRLATRNWLRLQAGLFEAIMLSVSYSLPLYPGKSIQYTDRDGVRFRGIVWSFQDSQTGNQARRSVLCIRARG